MPAISRSSETVSWPRRSRSIPPDNAKANSLTANRCPRATSRRENNAALRTTSKKARPLCRAFLLALFAGGMEFAHLVGGAALADDDLAAPITQIGIIGGRLEMRHVAPLLSAAPARNAAARPHQGNAAGDVPNMGRGKARGLKQAARTMAHSSAAEPVLRVSQS